MVAFSVIFFFYMFFARKTLKKKELIKMKYEDAKYLILTDYDRVNPVTQEKANQEWINCHILSAGDEFQRERCSQMMKIAQFRRMGTKEFCFSNNNSVETMEMNEFKF